MKAIMISIKPNWCAKIMNGEKTIEVRKNKKFANAIQKLINENGYADIYVYCTKEENITRISRLGGDEFILERYPLNEVQFKSIDYGYSAKGKVIFKFRCYKVEEFYPFFHWCIEKETCLTRDEVLDYLDNKDKNVWNPKRQDKVYAIHISDLEIIDKELYEFKIYCSKLYSIWAGKCDRCRRLHIDYEGYLNRCDRRLTKAPQNFVYIEIEKNEPNNI